jgi:hypothetical protein
MNPSRLVPGQSHGIPLRSLTPIEGAWCNDENRERRSRHEQHQVGDDVQKQRRRSADERPQDRDDHHPARHGRDSREQKACRQEGRRTRHPERRDPRPVAARGKRETRIREREEEQPCGQRMAGRASPAEPRPTAGNTGPRKRGGLDEKQRGEQPRRRVDVWTKPRWGDRICRARSGSHGPPGRSLMVPVISRQTVVASSVPGAIACRKYRRAGSGRCASMSGSKCPSAGTDARRVHRRFASRSSWVRRPASPTPTAPTSAPAISIRQGPSSTRGV